MSSVTLILKHLTDDYQQSDEKYNLVTFYNKYNLTCELII